MDNDGSENIEMPDPNTDNNILLAHLPRAKQKNYQTPLTQV